MPQKKASPTRFMYKIGLNTADEIIASRFVNGKKEPQKPYRLIFMNQNKVALVDEEDYERINQHKWYWGSSHKYAMYFMSQNGWRKSCLMHRFIMQPPEDMVVDHINHNRLDNRKANLRICTKSQNSMNIRQRVNNTSGYIGVFWNTHRAKAAWNAHVRVDKKKLNLGHFSTAQYAALARDAQALIHHGEFAVLNFGDWNE